MMWSFFPTKRMSFAKTIDASPEAVIAVLHDLDVFLRLHSFVIAVTPNASNPSQFTITDALPILGCFKVKTTFQATIDIQADGFIANVVAGAGTKQTTRYSVRVREDNRTEVIEHTTVKGFFLLMPFIVSELRTGHLMVLDNLAARFEK